MAPADRTREDKVLITELKIGLHHYPLKFVPAHEVGGDLAEVDHHARVIRISEDLRDRPELLFSTMLHELLHTIMEYYGKVLALGERDEERLIETLSEPLAAALVESGLVTVTDLEFGGAVLKEP